MIYKGFFILIKIVKLHTKTLDSLMYLQFTSHTISLELRPITMVCSYKVENGE